MTYSAFINIATSFGLNVRENKSAYYGKIPICGYRTQGFSNYWPGECLIIFETNSNDYGKPVVGGRYNFNFSSEYNYAKKLVSDQIKIVKERLIEIKKRKIETDFT